MIALKNGTLSKTNGNTGCLALKCILDKYWPERPCWRLWAQIEKSWEKFSKCWISTSKEKPVIFTERLGKNFFGRRTFRRLFKNEPEVYPVIFQFGKYLEKYYKTSPRDSGERQALSWGEIDNDPHFEVDDGEN